MRSKCFQNFSVVVVLTVKKKDDITCVRLQLKISFISFGRQFWSAIWSSSQIAASVIHCWWTSSSSCSSSESAQSHRLKQLFPVKGGFSSNERVVRRETSWKITLGVAVLVTQVGLLVTGWWLSVRRRGGSNFMRRMLFLNRTTRYTLLPFLVIWLFRMALIKGWTGIVYQSLTDKPPTTRK